MAKGMAEQDETRDGFMRQRRFLMLLSLGLFTFHLAGGRFQEAASTNGFGVHLERPWILVVLGWTAFVWALWRFYQFRREFGTSAAANARQECEFRAAEKIGRPSIVERLHQNKFHFSAAHPGLVLRHLLIIRSQGYEHERDGSRHYKSVNLYLSRPDGTDHPTTESTNLNFTPTEVAKIRRWGYLFYVIDSHHWTDRDAPLLLACTPPIVAAVQGSVLLVRFFLS